MADPELRLDADASADACYVQEAGVVVRMAQAGMAQDAEAYGRLIVTADGFESKARALTPSPSVGELLEPLLTAADKDGRKVDVLREKALKALGY
jgi:hypothetical protein